MAIVTPADDKVYLKFVAIFVVLVSLFFAGSEGCNIPFEDVGPGCQSGYLTGQTDGFADAYACLEDNWFYDREGGVYGDCYREGYYEAYTWATTSTTYDTTSCPDGVEPNPDNRGVIDPMRAEVL